MAVDPITITHQVARHAVVRECLHDLLRRIHGVTASIIILGAILHILAALKHIVINRDGTFDKIMIADGAEQVVVPSASKVKA